MGSGLGSIYLPPANEPGKARAAWSGHNGEHVTMVELLGEVRAALAEGDVKAAYEAASVAIAFNIKRGRGVTMPLEAPEQRSLIEAQFQLASALQDVKFIGVARQANLERASEYLAQAEQKSGYSMGGYAETSMPEAAPMAEVTGPSAPSGGDHSHDEAVDAAIAAIDRAIQQELAENEDDDDSASLRVAKAALQQFLAVEHAEYDDDAS